MIRKEIRFVMPRTMEEAVLILDEVGPDGRVLGGGSVLVTAMSAGLGAPKVVIDPAKLGLDQIDEHADSVSIGARTTYAALLKSEIISERLPLLRAMVEEVTGGPGLWNLATVGGSCCYANPASDAPACLTALNAQFHLASTGGTRVVSAKNFFKGAFVTDRAPNEMLSQIQIPFGQAVPRTAYFKLKHSASSWPIVTAACQLVEVSGEKHLCLAMGGLSARPVFAEWRSKKPFSEKHAEAFALEATSQVSEAWADELADATYRLRASKTVALRVFKRVLGDDKCNQN